MAQRLEIVKSYMRFRTLERAYLITENNNRVEIAMRRADNWLAKKPLSCSPLPSALAPGQQIYSYVVDRDLDVLLPAVD